MRNLARFALSIGAVALLAGCGVLRQAQDDTPSTGALPEAANSAVRRNTSSDLLYLSTDQGMDVFTYRGGAYVQSISMSGSGNGICSDKAGNVWVPRAASGSGPSSIYEYAHGGTSPIASLSDPGLAVACSVDPKSGDLAVGDYAIPGPGGDVAIYKSGSGSPTTYSLGSASGYSCTYDSNGNLFIGTNQGGGWDGLFELPKGGSQLVEVSLNYQIGGQETNQSVQWDGHYIAITQTKLNNPAVIYRFSMSGSGGTLQSTMKLQTRSVKQRASTPRTWIQGNRVMLPGKRGNVGLWQYPYGGHQRKHVDATAQVFGVTVSVAR
jgi:hypothetical protein